MSFCNHYLSCCFSLRFELTGLPSSAAVAEGVTIKTTDNAAYELMKQGRGEPEEEGYELVASPPRGSSVANVEVMYEVPSAPPRCDPLPAILPPVARAGDEEEEGVYEVIPGDK